MSPLVEESLALARAIRADRQWRARAVTLYWNACFRLTGIVERWHGRERRAPHAVLNFGCGNHFLAALLLVSVALWNPPVHAAVEAPPLAQPFKAPAPVSGRIAPTPRVFEVKSPWPSLIKPDVPLRRDMGAIFFWATPSWAVPRKKSSTFLSMRWLDSRQSYLAISQGWWEPAGAARLYFVLSNQDFLSCSYLGELPTDRKSLVGVTWTTGQNGFCRIYINGARVAESAVGRIVPNSVGGEIWVGSDRGATDQRQRTAEAGIGPLYLFESALSDSTVLDFHAALEGGARIAEERRWDWANLTGHSKAGGIRTAGKFEGPRVLFDESWQWARSKRDVDEVVARASRAGFNVLVPAVWLGGGTHFPSAVAHPLPELASTLKGGFDPLEYLIQAARAARIEVHPMFTVARREGDALTKYFGPGVPAGAFDMHDPGFRQFIKNTIVDAVRRYDVDGINLDYIRTMGVCRTTGCMKDFRAKYHSDLEKDIAVSGVDLRARQRIQEWQDETVRSLVASIAAESRALRPHMVISVDGHPVAGGRLRDLQGRDEIRWIREGLVDVVFNMEYQTPVDMENHAAVTDEIGSSGRAILLLANFDRIDGRATARPGWVIDRLARYARDRLRGQGVGFYLRAMLNDEQVEALRWGAFKEKAPPDWTRTTGDRK